MQNNFTSFCFCYLKKQTNKQTKKPSKCNCKVRTVALCDCTAVPYEECRISTRNSVF